MRKQEDRDIVRFIQRNQSCRRVDMVKYFTKEISKGGKIYTISESTLDKRLASTKSKQEDKTITNYGIVQHTKNTKPKNQKNISKPNKENKNQQENTKEKITTANFVTTTKEDAKVAESMQDTIFLLDSTMYLLDTIHADDIRARRMKKKSRYNCRIFKATLEKVINEKFGYLLEPHHNRYQELIETTWKQYSEKHIHNSRIRFYNINNFRDVFSDVILQMRQSCEDNCKKFTHHETYYKDAVYASCKLVSTSLNEICRNDYDLVVDSYKYDDKLGMFSINISELKMLSSYDITKVYCNGVDCIFDVNDEKKSVSPSYSDHTISFYPDGIVNDDSIHIISIMLQRVEFSFVINGKQREYSTFLDYIKNDVVVQTDSIYPQYKSNTVMLTPKIGGEIKRIIESHYDKKFGCICGESHPCYRWLGYLHDNGTPDKEDKKYWMAIKCWNSNNYMSLHKILNHIVDPDKPPT